ncbi:MAG: hypothetical protein P8Z37_09765 [Acidobacteriota bacterium]|jgi:hypothetical protein
MNSGLDPLQSAENKSHLVNRTGRQPDESPALPGFSTWRAVYWCIIAVFILYIVLMRAFQGFFS